LSNRTHNILSYQHKPTPTDFQQGRKKKGMGSLFGKPASKTSGSSSSGSKGGSKKNAITEKDRAILDLKIARDKLTKYQKRIQIESEKLLKQAQVLLNSGHKVIYIDFPASSL
jgi:hypothetical protein